MSKQQFDFPVVADAKKAEIVEQGATLKRSDLFGLGNDMTPFDGSISTLTIAAGEEVNGKVEM